MSPNDNRITMLSRLIDEYRADGVIDVILQACHTYNMETHRIKEFVRQEKHIPYMSIETDYSQSDEGQLSTRVRAFIEMMETQGRKRQKIDTTEATE
jgi:benzoyl-CoA reductase/2-hydroxyglutaryl-CoA dehydratase subunit BcrC/BadD/HgdB